uniref:Small integral membrane protein 19 n=2 Tax=Oryctolagus cuniculus TaxID=9986 RepID=G1SK66_RABIT
MNTGHLWVLSCQYRENVPRGLAPGLSCSVAVLRPEESKFRNRPVGLTAEAMCTRVLGSHWMHRLICRAFTIVNGLEACRITSWTLQRLFFSSPMAASFGVMGDDGSIDYTVHEAWNEATNVYLIVILVSFGLFMYAKRNKRKIMRIFSVPPTEEASSEPNFYDTISKIRLRQQLEMYSISRKYEYQQPQSQADSVQLVLE